MKGMSWLENALAQNEETVAFSEDFKVAGTRFDLAYNPSGGKLNSDTRYEQKGSLAIRHNRSEGITFKYKLFIRQAGGEFVQWGELGVNL